MTSNIWHKAFTITTKSIHGYTYVVNIYTKDTVSSVVALTPAREVFSFQEDDNDDLMTPMRGSTGYIRYIYEGTDYDIRPEGMLDRFVEVTRQGTGSPTIFWQGFLTPEAYNQPFDSAPYEVEIPCQSILDALECVRMELPTDGSGKTTFAQLIVSAFDDMMGETTNILAGIIFPRVNVGGTIGSNDPFRLTTYRWGFCNVDEDDPNANDMGMVGWTWKKVIEEYMKLFGACIRMRGDLLYMTVPTNETAYNRYDWAYLRGNASSYWNTAPVLNLFERIEIESTDNTVNMIRPKESVLYTLDSQNLSFGAEFEENKIEWTGISTLTRGSDGTYYWYFDKNTSTTSQANLTLLNNTTPCFFDIWKISEDEKKPGFNWTKGLNMKADTSTGSTYVPAFTITCPTPFRDSTYSSGLVLSGKALKNLKADTSANAEILVTIQLGKWYWYHGGGWQKHNTPPTGMQPIGIPLDNDGNIEMNGDSFTSTPYYEYASESGYLILFDSNMNLDDIAYPLVLTVYQPRYTNSDDEQQITDIKLNYTRENTYNLDQSNVYYKEEHEDGDGEVKIQLNAFKYGVKGTWYAPDSTIIRKYPAVYFRTGKMIKMGSAIGNVANYHTMPSPIDILNYNGMVYKSMACGGNTYDDCAEFTIFNPLT